MGLPGQFSVTINTQEFYFAGGKQSPSSDLYALGATFYHLISGEAPPNSQTRMAEFAGKNPDPCEPLAGRFPEYEPEFLEAIDKAMAILPRERIQTAREWLNIVTGRKDKVRPIRQTSTDDLNKVLTRLVSETNEYLSAEPRGADPRTRRQPTHAERPTSKPEWADDFNAEEEDTSDTEVDAETDNFSEPVYAQPGKLAVPARRRGSLILRLFGLR